MSSTTHTMSPSQQDFQSLRREKGVTSRAIADLADIPLRVEYLYEIGAPTDQETKEKIVGALSQLAGHPYRVSDFEPEGASEQPTQALPNLPVRVFFPSNQHGNLYKRGEQKV